MKLSIGFSILMFAFSTSAFALDSSITMDSTGTVTTIVSGKPDPVILNNGTTANTAITSAALASHSATIASQNQVNAAAQTANQTAAQSYQAQQSALNLTANPNQTGSGVQRQNNVGH